MHLARVQVNVWERKGVGEVSQVAWRAIILSLV